MKQLTQQQKTEWATSPIVKREKIDSSIVHETCANGVTYVLERQGNQIKNSTMFKLVGSL